MPSKYVQTTLPEDAWKDLKIKAVQENLSMAELLRSIILNSLKEGGYHARSSKPRRTNGSGNN